MALLGPIPFSGHAASGSAATISLEANPEGQHVVRGISGAVTVASAFGVYIGTDSGSTIWAANYNPFGTLDGFDSGAQRILCGKGNAVQIILKNAGTINAWGDLDPK